MFSALDFDGVFISLGSGIELANAYHNPALHAGYWTIALVPAWDVRPGAVVRLTRLPAQAFGLPIGPAPLVFPDVRGLVRAVRSRDRVFPFAVPKHHVAGAERPVGVQTYRVCHARHVHPARHVHALPSSSSLS